MVLPHHIYHRSNINSHNAMKIVTKIKRILKITIKNVRHNEINGTNDNNSNCVGFYATTIPPKLNVSAKTFTPQCMKHKINNNQMCVCYFFLYYQIKTNKIFYEKKMMKLKPCVTATKHLHNLCNQRIGTF